MAPSRPQNGNIVQQGNPVLRGTAKLVPITDINSKEIRGILSRMSAELASQHDGVALAAPQIGVPLRIFIVSKKVFALDRSGRSVDPDEMDASEPITVPDNDLVFINPKITKLSRKKTWVPEGCLSVRWFYGETHRADKVTIDAYDENGKRFTRGGSGLLAQIFQHETDHLDGVLFVDHARNIEEMSAEEIARIDSKHTAQAAKTRS